MTIDTNIAASHEPSTETEDFVQRVRVNHTKLTSELKSHSDFLVCGSGSSMAARRLIIYARQLTGKGISFYTSHYVCSVNKLENILL